MAGGGLAIFRPAGEDGVQAPPVPGRHVLHVGDLFQPAFYLQGRDARVQQVFQIVAPVHVFQGEQVLSRRDLPPVRVDQGVGQAAVLGALAAVRAAPSEGRAQVALPAVAHAQGAVDEYLQRHGGPPGDFPYLLQGELAGQDDLREADVLQEAHLLRRAVVHLRAGVQRDGGQVHRGDGHVLRDEGVRARLVEPVDDALRLLQLLFLEDGVQCHVDAGAEQVGVVAQRADVVRRVAGGGACAEPGGADVDRVGAVADGLDAARQVLGGR